MRQTAPLIAENVSCRYGQTTIVNRANLTLEPGQITALLGPSGAGKSTLLRLFCGLETPSQGRILQGDTVLSDGGIHVPAERRRIGIVFQDFALFPNLTAGQNIAFGLAHLPKPDRLKLTADWLTRISLSDRADAYPHQLSGGEQQRVAIARALAPDPVALLMDEPFSGLDPALRDDVRHTALDAIASLGIPALLVTHDAAEAMLYADHLAIMRDGQISQQGAPDTLYAQPIDEATATALGPIIKLPAIWNERLGQIETALGHFPASRPPNSASFMAGIRPEAFTLSDDSPVQVRVLTARRNGAVMQLSIERESTEATILVPANETIEPMSLIGLRLNPALCFVL
jgi:iron(III) transport system ATP-binding protein